METDISLRALAEACGPDLLELLGSPDATVIGVESPELPATTRRLDTLFRLRSGGDTATRSSCSGYSATSPP